MFFVSSMRGNALTSNVCNQPYAEKEKAKHYCNVQLCMGEGIQQQQCKKYDCTYRQGKLSTYRKYVREQHSLLASCRKHCVVIAKTRNVEKRPTRKVALLFLSCPHLLISLKNL